MLSHMTHPCLPRGVNVEPNHEQDPNKASLLAKQAIGHIHERRLGNHSGSNGIVNS